MPSQKPSDLSTDAITTPERQPRQKFKHWPDLFVAMLGGLTGGLFHFGLVMQFQVWLGSPDRCRPNRADEEVNSIYHLVCTSQPPVLVGALAWFGVGLLFLLLTAAVFYETLSTQWLDDRDDNFTSYTLMDASRLSAMVLWRVYVLVLLLPAIMTLFASVIG